MVRSYCNSTKDSCLDTPSRHHLLSENESSPEKQGPHFKRVKPRIGSQFQTKTVKYQYHAGPVNAETFRNRRPSPERMSSKEPYFTVKEVERGHKRARVVVSTAMTGHDSRQGYDFNSTATKQDDLNTNPNATVLPPTRTTQRGGLCLHQAATTTTPTTDDYLLYCQHLMLPLAPDPPDGNDSLAEESWKQEMIRKYGATSTMAPSRRGKNVSQSHHHHQQATSSTRRRGRGRGAGGGGATRGRKRKVPELSSSATTANVNDNHETTTPDVCESSSSRTTTDPDTSNNHTNRNTYDDQMACLRTKRQPKHLEDDSHMLTYLHTQHNGNTTTAQLALVVNLSTGRSHKTRTLHRKKQYKERFRQPNKETSLSWRKRYERTQPTMIGDVRSIEQPCYPYKDYIGRNQFKKNKNGNDNDPSMKSDTHPTFKNCTAVASSDIVSPSASIETIEDLKGVWRSVLSCGQAMEGELSAHLENNTNRTSSSFRKTRLCLSQVVSFCQNAYTLPTPEEAFGTRHIVVEQISICLNTILDHVAKARNVQTKITDKLYDETNEGIDLDALKKYLDETDRNVPIQLDESEVLYQQLEFAAEWQVRLDALSSTGSTSTSNSSSKQEDQPSSCHDVNNVDTTTDTLAMAEEMVQKAKKVLVFRSRNLVLVEQKMQKAYKLRDRIREWLQSKQEGKKESTKFISAMMREANRLDYTFGEMTALMEFHQSMEVWVDRANIAIRSRISLSEIVSLVDQGEETELDLSEFLEKLRSRVRLAHEWVERFTEDAPCPFFPDGTTVDHLEWMSRIRKVLASVEDGTCAHLMDMASEGSRIPVEIDPVKMLQLEIDAKNWSIKGKKWIPPRTRTKMTSDDDTMADASNATSTTTTFKRGKLEDLREHIEKGDAIREKLWLSQEKRQAWKLEGEVALKSIVQAADDWFDEYESYLEGDNRRSESRSCVSVPKLRQIVEESNRIDANIGPAVSKISRILVQAENWYEKHQNILVRCRLTNGDESSPLSASKLQSVVALTSINSAVQEAYSDVSLDLEEALNLKMLSDRVANWFERALLAAPKRSKRNVRGKAKWGKPPKTVRYSLEELIGLIDEAPTLPIDTTEDVHRLQIQLNTVQTWRFQAQRELRKITTSFTKLRNALKLTYGLSAEFFQEETGILSIQKQGMEQSESPEDCPGTPDDSSRSDTGSNADSDKESIAQPNIGGGHGIVHKQIANLLKTAKSMGVCTAEEKVAERLEKVSKWYLKSSKYIATQKDLFEKRFYSSFDKFVEAGAELAVLSNETDNENFRAIDDLELMSSLSSSWGSIISDQLIRLRALQLHRDHFIVWSDNAAQLLSAKDKSLSLDILEKLAKECTSYPSTTDMVQRVRNLANQATAWVESMNTVLNSEEKLTMDGAKVMFEKGDKLNVACKELKVLRQEIRNARGWATRVKRSKLDQGATHINTVYNLIDEHDSFLIELPDVVKKLRQAMRGYCICRRPYEGFMIGCDECDEWFHGSCIGVSESQADKCEKYTCLKCNFLRVYKSSSASIVSVVRKWISPKDLRKVRQADSQKHQRKFRKENRDIEKLEPQIQSLEKELEACIKVNKEEEPSTTAKDGPLVAAGISIAINPTPSTFVDESSSHDSKSDKKIGAIDKIVPDEVVQTKDISNDSHTSASKNIESATDVPLLENIKNGIEESLEPGTVTCSNEKETSQLTYEVIEAKLKKAKAALRHCHCRLELLSKQAANRKAIEWIEDNHRDVLRNWCLRLSCSAMIPVAVEGAEESRPLADGFCSLPMLTTTKDVEMLGIARLPDVALVKNAFACISWSFFGMTMLAKKPSFANIQSLILKTSSIKLPEEKSARMLKAMVQRASLWQAKVAKTLAPKPGETKPYCLPSLKELMLGLKNIPMVVPEESRLINAIEDQGARHCICGGPSDGTFMLGCDKCERWFHGRCVKVGNDAGDALQNWICPPCSGIPQPPLSLTQHQSVMILDDSDDQSEEGENVPDQSQSVKLWPPYGLLHGTKALEVLGKEAFTILDIFSRGDALQDEELVRTNTEGVEKMNSTIKILEAEKLLGAKEVPCDDEPSENSPLAVSPELTAMQDGKDGNEDNRTISTAAHVIKDSDDDAMTVTASSTDTKDSGNTEALAKSETEFDDRLTQSSSRIDICSAIRPDLKLDEITSDIRPCDTARNPPQAFLPPDTMDVESVESEMKTDPHTDVQRARTAEANQFSEEPLMAMDIDNDNLICNDIRNSCDVGGSEQTAQEASDNDAAASMMPLSIKTIDVKREVQSASKESSGPNWDQRAEEKQDSDASVSRKVVSLATATSGVKDTHASEESSSSLEPMVAAMEHHTATKVVVGQSNISLISATPPSTKIIDIGRKHQITVAAKVVCDPAQSGTCIGTISKSESTTPSINRKLSSQSVAQEENSKQ